MPIYHVKTPQGEKLVDANTKAQAINHVVRSTITAETVTASEVVALMQAGVVVEKVIESEPKSEQPEPKVDVDTPAFLKN